MTKAPNSEAPVSVRDAIRASMDEHREQEEKEAKLAAEAKEKEEKEEKQPEKVVAEVVEEKEEKEVKEEAKEPVEVEEKEPKAEEQKVSSDKLEKGTLPVPVGLTKEIRGKWQDYDTDTQAFITKSLKDANDARASAGRISSHTREVETVLTPYTPKMQEIGVTPAQVVKKVLEYTDGLAGPNKYQVLQDIARDFNIDLTRFGKSKQPTQGQETDPQTDAEETFRIDLPPETHAKLDKLLSRAEQEADASKTAQHKAAEDTVNAWSGFDPATGEHRNKPYYPTVRQTMFTLMKANPSEYITASGIVDLDKVYEAACYAIPDVRETIAHNQKLEQDRLAAKKKKELEKAQAKNLSLKPSASSLSSRSASSQANGKDKGGKSVSVRQSIEAAIQENR